MLVVLVQGALTILDKAVFDTLASCPYCGGPVAGYDKKTRHFADILEKSGNQTVTVTVKRFQCRSCKKIVNADEPFYPDTRIGSPVIDLCIAFSRAYGYGRGARNLRALGVALDRMQCRHYAGIPVPPFRIMPMYGVPIPQSIISLSFLTASLPEGRRVTGAEALAACGFPSAHRAALHHHGVGEERDEGNTEEGNKERETDQPEDRTHQQGPGEEGERNNP